MIGAGKLGRNFALRCAESGFAVVLEDVLSSNLRKADEESETMPSASRDRLQLATSVEDAVRTADLAIDFVPDELESKLEIFSLMDRMAPPHTLFCTPTALSITDLASCTYRAPLCIGLQPFVPEEQDVLCLVRGAATSTDTTSAVHQWLTALGYGVQISYAPAFTASSF